MSPFQLVVHAYVCACFWSLVCRTKMKWTNKRTNNASWVIKLKRFIKCDSMAIYRCGRTGCGHATHTTTQFIYDRKNENTLPMVNCKWGSEMRPSTFIWIAMFTVREFFEITYIKHKHRWQSILPVLENYVFFVIFNRMEPILRDCILLPQATFPFKRWVHMWNEPAYGLKW